MFITRRAMTALDELRQLREHYGDAGPSVFGMTAKTNNRRVKAAAQAAGLGEGFSGHSGRVGLARAGVPGPASMRLGPNDLDVYTFTSPLTSETASAVAAAFLAPRIYAVLFAFPAFPSLRSANANLRQVPR